MSRKDSRQVNCEKAITRNKSVQSKVRTPASPECLSMMRPKVFHGTYSMICANSVLPTFMRHPRSSKPESIANAQSEIQIVDTHESIETRISIGLAAALLQINRTLVVYCDYFIVNGHHKGHAIPSFDPVWRPCRSAYLYSPCSTS